MSKGPFAALIVRRDIKGPGGKFSVRGLSADDVFALYRRHTGELAAWFEKLGSGEARVSLNATTMLAGTLLDTAPLIAAEIIAAGTEAGADDETIADIRKLPLSVQASALEAIGELTFTQEMPPKKLLEIVVRMSRSLSETETPAT